MRPQSQLMVNRRRRRLPCCRSWLTWSGYGVQVCLSCRPPQQPLACLAMRTGLSWYLLPAYALHHTQGQYQFQGCERDVTLPPRPCHRLRPLRRTRQPSSSRPSQHCLSHADPERREILHLQGRSDRTAFSGSNQESTILSAAIFWSVDPACDDACATLKKAPCRQSGGGSAQAQSKPGGSQAVASQQGGARPAR